jgi:hypothetical protein
VPTPADQKRCAVDKKLELLARVPLFSDLDKVGLAQVAKLADEIALLDGGQRSATATAVTPVSLLILGRREFNSLLNEFPDIRSSVLKALADRVCRLENTVD